VERNISTMERMNAEPNKKYPEKKKKRRKCNIKMKHKRR